MSNLFRKLAKLRPWPVLSSGAHFKAPKMVRFFPNKYEDFQPGSVLSSNNDHISLNINEHVTSITKRLQPTHKNVDGGLYVGVTGVAYMFHCLSKNCLLSANKKNFLQSAADYLKPALQTSAGDQTSFLLGDAGTYALAAVINKEIDKPFEDYLNKYKSLYSCYLKPNFLKCGGDEFFVGRAGYIAGALWLRRELKRPVLTNQELYKLCDVIVQSGSEYAKKQSKPCPLMFHYYNTEYLGAAHGISFILQMLLSVPGYLEYNEEAAKSIEETVRFLASIQTNDGNWPCCLEELSMGEHKLMHWCHGAPGMIYLMAKAYLIYKDKLFYDACLKAGDAVWQRGLLRKGPGICHGVAGNGYAFLLLYRLTGNDQHMYRALKFAEFMTSDEFLRDSRVPDNPETLYEGTAGTVCFLSDLLVPDKAEFPFQDVFSSYAVE